MIQNTSCIHSSVLHTYIGITGIVMFILSPVLGQVFLKIKKHKKFLRTIHKLFGRIIFIVVFAAVIFGLFQTGIL